MQSEKSKLTAYLLWLAIGAFGAHRFYLGRVKSGIALAVLLILWSVLYFRANKTTIEPHHTPTALITKGPYRISRNPIYLAMVVASIGWALWCGTLSAFVGPVILAWVLHNRFVLPEEAKLREAFGAKAEAYITKTKRWV
jgi:protein-S-isoprenylcysteine O-methyltransferase Ste14